MIEIVTFTGVDEKTDLTALELLSRQYPHAEFGVLLGSHTSEKSTGIFPAFRTIGQLRNLCAHSGVRAAIHLCGKYARAAAAGDVVTDELMLKLYGGFNRVQINLHGDELDPARVDVWGDAVAKFAGAVACDSVILQHRGDWASVPVVHHKVEYLFDLSEGAGIQSFDDWPPPPIMKDGHLLRAGYAGGLSPRNIGQAIAFARKYDLARLWFDMESQIRTNGAFDLDKVRAVCAQVWG